MGGNVEEKREEEEEELLVENEIGLERAQYRNKETVDLDVFPARASERGRQGYHPFFLFECEVLHEMRTRTH